MTLLYKKITTLVSIVLLVAALASCGGGGGGGGAPAPLPYQSIITVDPGNTYSSDDLQISNEITAIRQGAQGAGYFKQNTFLDNAASNHADFLVINNLVSNAAYLTSYINGILGGHYENSSLSGYTGASPQTRATAAGYTGTKVTELMTFGAASGADCVASQGNSVYHLIELISPFMDVGISFNPGTGSGSACAIEVGVGSNTAGQLPATDPVVYPYDTQTGVLPTFYNQAEDPVPASDLLTAGHPVVVSLYTLASPTLNGSNIVINTFSITRHSDLTLVSARVLVASSGVTSTGPALTVDSLIPGAGFVVLLPTVPLDPFPEQYDVSFSATVKGNPVTKNWIFTTGAPN